MTEPLPAAGLLQEAAPQAGGLGVRQRGAARLDARRRPEHQDGAPREHDPDLPPRWRRVLANLRARIVLWYVALLVIGLTLAIASVHLTLVERLDQRIDRELRQEVEELRSLADGLDPATGEPFAGDVERLFEVFLSRNIPVRHETIVTFVDGEPFRRSVGRSPARLDLEPMLAARWARLAESARGRVHLPDVGQVEYLAVPIRVDGEAAAVFVVAHFRDLERAELVEALRIAALVGLGVLLLAIAIAWNVAGRILEPVRAVTATARTISDSDLSRRIPTHGADEVSVLAGTFNRMLDRLETAFASQRDFMDDVGHELRTPITIVRGHLELLDHADPRERAQTIALVVDELDRMHRFVEDLLLLAKAERPDFLDLQAVDVDALTREVHAKAQALAARQWRLNGRARARVVADRQRLTQALVQLCENAARHTREGATIAIGSALAEREVRLWVRDTGPGVTPADRERIFERFARGAGSRAASGGAGLGLAIVRAIAEAHGGRVELESPPGGGVVFTLVVPVDQGEAP